MAANRKVKIGWQLQIFVQATGQFFNLGGGFWSQDLSRFRARALLPVAKMSRCRYPGLTVLMSTHWGRLCLTSTVASELFRASLADVGHNYRCCACRRCRWHGELPSGGLCVTGFAPQRLKSETAGCHKRLS